jgi:Lrp/AsnC family transcriptional regulator for asnA, asnC and gidA
MCAKKKEEIVKLDETDIKILKIINDDVRISYR